MTCLRVCLFLLVASTTVAASAQRAAPPRPSATMSVVSVTGALTTGELEDLPTRAGPSVTRCATRRTATIVTDDTTVELAIDERGRVTTATVMGVGDIVVDEARTRWLACATQALERLTFPRHDVASTVSLRLTWSSGAAARGGELGSRSDALGGRRSSTFDHAIETRRRTAPTTAAGYSRDVVARVVSTHAAEVRHCYDTQLDAHPGMEGTLTLAFTIAPDGTVTSATPEQDQPHVAALTECVIGALRRWTFPAPEDGAPAAVSYPFVFRQSDHPGR